jgi:hypothetical protein
VGQKQKRRLLERKRRLLQLDACSSASAARRLPEEQPSPPRPLPRDRCLETAASQLPHMRRICKIGAAGNVGAAAFPAVHALRPRPKEHTPEA